MSAAWMDGTPFVFSIALKLGSSITDTFFSNRLIKDIPDNYKLAPAQKETIAAQALDANERLVFMVTMFGSIVAAAAICLKKQQTGIFMALLLVLTIAGALGIPKMNSYDLGYLETKVNVGGRQVRRSTIVLLFLIVIDLALGCLSVFL